MRSLALTTSLKSFSLCHSPSRAAPRSLLEWRTRGTSAARPVHATARADTVPVWETLVVVNSAPDALQSSDEQQELLDTLWSLQYRTPGACCASAGPVVHAASRDGSATPRAAVYYRFSAQTQAERFVAGPSFADAKARLLGSASVSLALWRVLVPNDMEALFKRGPAFEVGVDLILVLQPTAALGGGTAPPVPADVVVEVVGRLQSAALSANSVQVSCGMDVMSLDTKYVWMTRFPQEDAALRFLRSRVVSELAVGMAMPGSAATGVAAAGAAEVPGGPLALSSLAIVEVGAVEQSKQRL